MPPCWIHGTQKAILSDSLPCLICYHKPRCYTYTHSAFWSFWLYGKIQMYPLPKRYRQFFSWIPHDQIPWYLSLLVKRASVTRRTNHLFSIPLWRLWWITPLVYLVTWAFRPIDCKPFACVAVLACTTFSRVCRNRTDTSTPVHPHPLRNYLPSCS